MIKPEMAWYDNNDSMRLQEDFVAYLVARVLERRSEELKVLERDTKVLESSTTPFHRLDYTDAITLLNKKGSATVWGEDLGAEDESLIVEDYGSPVLRNELSQGSQGVLHEGKSGRSAHGVMRHLLAPEGYGEIVGGSQREDDYDRLLQRIIEEKLPVDAYGWYLDLRKYGTFVHSGFGLGPRAYGGVDMRLPHIREAIAFPRMMHHAYMRDVRARRCLSRFSARFSPAFTSSHNSSCCATERRKIDCTFTRQGPHRRSRRVNFWLARSSASAPCTPVSA